MHKKIKKYTHDGFIRDDTDFIRLRNELEKLIIEQMRSEGHLPIYELGSFWSTKWEPENKRYSFKLTMYSSYAGRVKALEYDFWNQGRLMKSG